MKKFYALALLVIFLLSVPAVFAQDTVDTTSPEDTTSNAVEDSEDRNDDSEDDKDDDTDRPRRDRLEQTRDNLRDRAQERRQEFRQNNPDATPEERRERAKQVVSNAKEHRKAALERALANCKEHANDNARCEEAIRKRLDNLDKLDEAHLKRAKHAEERLAKRHKDLKRDRVKAHFRQFKGEHLKAREVAKVTYRKMNTWIFDLGNILGALRRIITGEGAFA